MTTNTNSTCLCGAVKLSINELPDKVGACHCNMCRKWGGGPFISMQAGQGFSIDGEESVKIYDSSAWAERAFCVECGTHLFFRIKGSSDHYVLAGLMGVGDNAELEHQLFIDEKPAYYSLGDNGKQYTGQEFLDSINQSNTE